MPSGMDDRDFERLDGPDAFDIDEDDDRADSQTIGTSYAEEEADIKRLKILATYQDVWREFYEWEPGYCSQLLRSFTSAEPSPHDVAFPFHTESDDMDVDEVRVDATVTEDGGTFTACIWDGPDFTDFSKDHLACAVPQSVKDKNTRETRLGSFADHRPYESCTPSNANVFINVTAAESTCKFIKYSDDVNFDSRNFMEKFYSIDWQRQWRDPDSELDIMNSCGVSTDVVFQCV